MISSKAADFFFFCEIRTKKLDLDRTQGSRVYVERAISNMGDPNEIHWFLHCPVPNAGIVIDMEEAVKIWK